MLLACWCLFIFLFPSLKQHSSVHQTQHTWRYCKASWQNGRYCTIMYLLDSLQMLYSYLTISYFLLSNFQQHKKVFEKEIKKEWCMESYVHLGKGPNCLNHAKYSGKSWQGWGRNRTKRCEAMNRRYMNSSVNDKPTLQIAAMFLQSPSPSLIFPSLPFQTDSVLVQSHTVLPFGLASVLREKKIVQ